MTESSAAASCLFCRIARGELRSTKVAESEHALAFRDVNPVAPSHVLLIPKEHVAESAAALGPAHGALLGELFALAARVAADEGLERGWRLVVNVGPDAGQTVPHLHMHMLGGRALDWPPG
ncbi:MAG TPA: histidine triad nucleotide-binding protein [Candidatus Eisenbacteria bacterium]|nr:histidine triad nucleotide-binding protein [Candidatus Eisenbacteria bacterium]